MLKTNDVFCAVRAVSDVAATIELLEALCAVGTEEDQLLLEAVVTRVASWHEMAARLRGHKPGSGGKSTVGSHYQAT